ncbi:MAG: hypothetical protein OER88_09830, partial [Planctomycetota bacterium]|nr:hypothetical protein [Planctomycetota bacterium]
MRQAFLLTFCLLGVSAAGDAPPNGPRRIEPGVHALVGAQVHIDPTTQAAIAVVIRDGRIAAIGGAVPGDAREWDTTGLHVYAGFIDAHVAVDVSKQKGTHWNTKVRPRRHAVAIPNDLAKELRGLGFTAAVAAPQAGIFRGRAALLSL